MKSTPHRSRLWLEELDHRTVPSTVVGQVAVINPGGDSQIAGTSISTPVPLTVNEANLNGVLIFSANDGVHGNELWKSDGTAAGTSLVKDITPGASGSQLSDITTVGNTVYFLVGSRGSQSLWKTDGTTAGTVLVQDLSGANVFDLTNFNGTLFFSEAILGAGGELEKSDGTAAGTVPVGASFNKTSGIPLDMTVVGNTLFFQEGDQLWMTDGTAAGTMAVNGSPSGVDADLTVVGSMVFFTTTDQTNGTVLWQMDGTAAPIRLKQISTSPLGPQTLVNVNGMLFFAINGSSGGALWKTDGTVAGTVLVKDINPGGNFPFPENLTAVGNTLFFTVADSALWKSDGTAAGTVQVKQINPSTAIANPLNLLDLTALGHTLFLAANDGTHGSELWQSDGTADGTVLVQDILPGAAGSNPGALIAVGNRLFFAANDTAASRQLWATQITNGGNFDKLGAYRPSDGSWSLDSNGAHLFDPTTSQVFFNFSPPGVTGVAGDWNGTGHSQIGDFSNGVWHLDLVGTGAAPGANETFQFGQADDQPVVGDWDGNPSGRDELGVFRTAPDGITGEFILDIANHKTMDSSNLVFTFGFGTDHIVVGDWNGNGTTEVGVYRDAKNFIAADAGDIVFSINSNGDHATFTNFVFGLITDHVVIGDWTGDGIAKVGVYRDGSNGFNAPGVALFSLDSGALMFNAQSQVFLFGLITDQFVAGDWSPTPPLLPEGTPQAQFAAGGQGPGGMPALTEAQLEPVLRQAIFNWEAQGASAAQLESAQVQIGTLDDNLVGLTSDNQITIDATADGWGWNTDTSTVAAGKMDLLTVVEHELGHELGLSDVDPATHPGDLMAATLPTGTRRLIGG